MHCGNYGWVTWVVGAVISLGCSDVHEPPATKANRRARRRVRVRQPARVFIQELCSPLGR